MAKKTSEKFEFKAEVKQLLDLVVHSLYSHKDIFLRELISNAADAIDKRRFEALTNSNMANASDDWKIKITTDDKEKTLTISDNGIGMTKDNLIDQLGTIAKSGTKSFIEQIKESKEKNSESINLIGQFGVGFYASFMVSDKVSVLSKQAGTDSAAKWISTGEGDFEIEDAQKEEAGTEITLYLKEDSLTYLKEWEIKTIVKKYSDFVEHAIIMDIEREEKPKDAEGKEIEDSEPAKIITEEILNSRKAIWTKAKKDVSDEEYSEFYKHLSHDYTDPFKNIHYSAEGTIEFKALLYIPKKAPADLFYPDSIKGIHLYVKRVFIMDDCKKLVPEYLRFIKGVVDSNDLPLNVSREILQQDMHLDKIKKNLVSKILNTLKTLQKKEYSDYVDFYKEFGPVLKEGLHYDYDNKEKISDLILFKTTKTSDNEYKSLKQYIDDMPKDQKEIYYFINQDKDTALSSPHLEIFKNKEYEVILMLDSVDEWVISALPEYKGKKFKAIDKGDIKLEDNEQEEEKLKEKQEKHKNLLEFIKKELETKIKEARFSSRLTDSPSCLVSDEDAMSSQMEQMFRSMGQAVPLQQKSLEINPNHPVTDIMQNLFESDPAAPELKDYITLLYDQALLSEGSKIKDPLSFVKIVSKLMVKAAAK